MRPAAPLALVGWSRVCLRWAAAPAPPPPDRRSIPRSPASSRPIPSFWSDRLEASKKTPVYQKYLAHRRIPQIDQFAAETGIDPTKALWELLYVSNGQRGALIGRGNFSDEGEPKLQKRGEDRFSYKGLTLSAGVTQFCW